MQRSVGLVVRIDPRSEALRRLGVTHVLLRRPSREQYEELSGHRWIAAVGLYHIFAVD